jgi:hypothetical protein
VPGQLSGYSDQATGWTSEELGARQPLGANILQNVKNVLEFRSIPFRISVVSWFRTVTHGMLEHDLAIDKNNRLLLAAQDCDPGSVSAEESQSMGCL